MSLLERLTSLFAPDECLSCRREGSLLCADCSSSLAAPTGICFNCYAAVHGVVCPSCLQESGCHAIDAATDYQGVAKQLIASLKFVGNQSAARVMAERMHACRSLLPGTVITHMPATAAHIRQRGYDQAALLAKHLSRLGGARQATLLARAGKQHQLGASRQARLAQLNRALRIRRPDIIQGRSILLVDDVLTTGASIGAATAALLRAGAKEVSVLVFAQAVVSNLEAKQKRAP